MVNKTQKQVRLNVIAFSFNPGIPSMKLGLYEKVMDHRHLLPLQKVITARVTIYKNPEEHTGAGKFCQRWIYVSRDQPLLVNQNT